jgi:hypothetical protein
MKIIKEQMKKGSGGIQNSVVYQGKGLSEFNNSFGVYATDN